MDRVAVFVDAGYLFAEGSVAICGIRLKRGELTLDHDAVLDSLRAFAATVSGLPLLRIYWYDGTSQGPTPQHITLAGKADIKIRLGFVNVMGQQKGVDSLIVTDMISLARNGAMVECVLLSGDEDLRVGVQQAQEYGVRVHLLGIAADRGNQSTFLLQEADTTHEWGASDVGRFLQRAPHEPTAPRPSDESVAGETDEVERQLERVAQQVAAEIAKPEVAALVDLIRVKNQRPAWLDGQLLATSRRALGRDLDSTQKREVRDAFLKALESRLGGITG